MARPLKYQPVIPATLLAKLPRLPGPGPLDTLVDLQREWARLHRARTRGQIESVEFRDAVYSMQVGVVITRAAEQLRGLGNSNQLSTAGADLDLSRLNDTELEWLETIMQKAARPTAGPDQALRQRLDQIAPQGAALSYGAADLPPSDDIPADQATEMVSR